MLQCISYIGTCRRLLSSRLQLILTFSMVSLLERFPLNCNVFMILSMGILEYPIDYAGFEAPKDLTEA